MAFLVFQRFSPPEGVIFYKPGSLRIPIVLGMSGVSGLLAFTGFCLGISSIGHIRNDRQGRSWVGFLLGALGMVLALLLLLAFWLLKEPII